MRKLSICKRFSFFLLMGMLLCSGCQKEKDLFLPEAENDTIFTVIGDE